MNREFPKTRLRRTRMNSWSRELVQETSVMPKNLIWPVFIVDGSNKKISIPSMPRVFRLSIDNLLVELKEAVELGIKAVALFPVVSDDLKDDSGSEAVNNKNLICRSIKEIKQSGLEIGIITDVALDPYTTHGHDGIFVNDEIDNDASVKVLVEQALNQARAGCDIIAPSDMQDGRVGAIRMALENEGFKNTIILSYAAKFASGLYGPFRDAIGSSTNLSTKDKKSYQQDFHNSNESLHEVELDINEGADIVMVKPAIMYLDIINRIKETFKVSTFAYQVSGEYSMIELLAKQNETSHIDLHLEAIIAMRRAGADAILTYAAIDIARYIKELNYDN
jgi:porphobilinogen synthase